ncbi:hypothetical protein RhiirC2_793499 [Rhizophagus irregularis]|uniref:Uncharacterized protein n=1 Tax=Rhizophagus irregularis TaxID=588596 RepID=A0A2N1MFB6_9GLOM|nr:hypothetical protein RhiirC2_793499 [Rhizophagus irregularis]
MIIQPNFQEYSDNPSSIPPIQQSVDYQQDSIPQQSFNTMDIQPTFQEYSDNNTSPIPSNSTEVQLTAIGREGGPWFSWKSISSIIPTEPLTSPVSTDKFALSITRAPLDNNNCASRPFAVSESALEASLPPVCTARTLATGAFNDLMDELSKRVASILQSSIVDSPSRNHIKISLKRRCSGEFPD